MNEYVISGRILREIRSLGDLNSTEEEVLLKLISHVNCCDKWWLESDEDES